MDSLRSHPVLRPAGGLFRSPPAARLLLVACLLLGVLMPAAARADDPLFARMETDVGNMVLVLYPDLAPFHVGNFVHLAETGFYTGTIFHRIVPGFVIQGGDPLSKDEDPRNDGRGGPRLHDVLTPEEWQTVEKVYAVLAAKGYEADLNVPVGLQAEFSEKAHHVRGTLSMARSSSPNSAGSQFFVCVDATPNLDGAYTVFGQVFSGMNVADTIVGAEKNPSLRDYPAVPVHIRSITIFRGTDKLSAEEKADWDALDPGLKSVK